MMEIMGAGRHGDEAVAKSYSWSVGSRQTVGGGRVEGDGERGSEGGRQREKEEAQNGPGVGS